MGHKRKTGQRSKILFDTIDMQIVEILIKEESVAILELGKKLGNIKHSNVKKHLDRLDSDNLDIIKKERVPKSRKILISLSWNFTNSKDLNRLFKLFRKLK